MTIKVTETLMRHSQALYHALNELAKPEQVQGVMLTVFRGQMTHVFDSLNISRSYYTPIRTLLVENDCILIVQRGSRSVESIIVLQQEPSPEGMTMPPLTGRSHAAKVSARLDNLEERLGGLDIVKAFDNHEKRLKALEGKGRGGGGRVRGKK
jgi:hypothetical protein